MTATNEVHEMDVILATPATFEVDGIPVEVNRLRSRELFALLGIITRGLGPGVANVRFSGDADEVGAQFVGLFLMALPNAIDDAITFLTSIVHAKNPADEQRVAEALSNPDPDVLIDLFTVVAEQEQNDLAALVGKAKAAMAKMQSLYQTPKTVNKKKK